MRQILLYLTVFLAMTVAQGQVIFQKTYGGTHVDMAHSVCTTNDGGYIIAGETRSYGDLSMYDIYLLKIDSIGVLEWGNTFGTIMLADFGNSVQQTNDGGFIIAGNKQKSGGTYDAYLIKTSSNGNLQWSKEFGGTKYESAYSVRQTGDGGFIMAGETTSYGAGSVNTYLVKTDSDGTLQWAKTYGGTLGETGTAVQQTNDGGFIVTGLSQSYGAGGYDIYLVKTASDGNLQWTKTFGGTAYEYGYDVKQTFDSGFVIIGQTESFLDTILPDSLKSSDIYLVKTDSDGNMQWTKTFGGTSDDRGYSVQQTSDFGFIITGQTWSFGSGHYDLPLIKTFSDGTIEWAKTFGGTKAEIGNSVQQTTDGGFIVAGFTESFGSGLADIYLVKTDSNGNGGCFETVFTPTIYTGGAEGTGGTQNTGGMESIASTQMDSGGVETILCVTGSGVHEIALEIFITISPNPFSTQTTLQTAERLQNASLTVYNSVGQTVKHVDGLAGQTIILHRDNLPNGLYFVRLTQDNNTISADKFVIVDE